MVKQASVRKLYPNRIVIDIVERTPYAVWQKDGDVHAIAADGAPIDEVSDGPLRRPSLRRRRGRERTGARIPVSAKFPVTVILAMFNVMVP